MKYTHKNLKETFITQDNHPINMQVYDNNGELRVFDRKVLEEVVEDVWEDVTSECELCSNDGSAISHNNVQVCSFNGYRLTKVMGRYNTMVFTVEKKRKV